MAVRTWLGNQDSASPNDWSVAANWKENVVPVSTDDVFFSDNAISVTAGLSQAGVLLASLNFDLSYTGNIGASDTSFLVIGATILDIGQNLGSTAASGSPRLNLDIRGASTITVFATSRSSTDANRNPLRLLCDNASTDIFMRSGAASIADDGDQTATLGDINMDGDGATMKVGDGVTYTNLNVNRGNVEAFSMPATLVEALGGITTLQGVDALTTLVMDGRATVNSNIDGTITLVTGRSGTLRFTQSSVLRTVTDIVISGEDFNFSADFDVITITNGVTFAANLKALTIGSAASA